MDGKAFSSDPYEGLPRRAITADEVAAFKRNPGDLMDSNCIFEDEEGELYKVHSRLMTQKKTYLYVVHADSGPTAVGWDFDGFFETLASSKRVVNQT
jgi:hypothetical protein